MLEETSGLTYGERLERLLAHRLHQRASRVVREPVPCEGVALDPGESLLSMGLGSPASRAAQVEHFAEPAASISSLTLSLL